MQFSELSFSAQTITTTTPAHMYVFFDMNECLYTSILYTVVYLCFDAHHSLKAVSRFPPQGTCHQGCLPSGHKRLSPPLWHGRLCDCFPGLEEPCELPSGRRCAQRILHDFQKIINSKILIQNDLMICLLYVNLFMICFAMP